VVQNGKPAEHSPKTTGWYEQTCKYFREFLKENEPSTRPSDVGISQARVFVVALQSRPKRGTTKPRSSQSSFEIRTEHRLIRSSTHYQGMFRRKAGPFRELSGTVTYA
jgi:hypothetical protein